MASKDQVLLRLAPHLAQKHPEIFQALLARYENAELLDAAEEFIKYEKHAMSQTVPATSLTQRVAERAAEMLGVGK